MARLLEGKPCVIYGDGMNSRDFVYVGDVVAANRAAAAKRVGGVFNVGTGVETTVNQLWDEVARACGSSTKAAHEAPKAGEQRRSVLDVRKGRAALGLGEPVTLSEGLRRTAAWFRERPGS